MPEESKSEGEIENVRVVVRVRPMDKNELDSGSQNIIKTDKSNRCITVYKPNANSSEPPKVYFFDNVFGEESTQKPDFSPVSPAANRLEEDVIGPTSNHKM
ncbi:hypothetical protein quinque_015836 [Culex quinquefasciatus]